MSIGAGGPGPANRQVRPAHAPPRPARPHNGPRGPFPRGLAVFVNRGQWRRRSRPRGPLPPPTAAPEASASRRRETKASAAISRRCAGTAPEAREAPRSPNPGFLSHGGASAIRPPPCSPPPAPPRKMAAAARSQAPRSSLPPNRRSCRAQAAAAASSRAGWAGLRLARARLPLLTGKPSRACGRTTPASSAGRGGSSPLGGLATCATATGGMASPGTSLAILAAQEPPLTPKLGGGAHA